VSVCVSGVFVPQVCLSVGLDGLIISNTTISRPSSLIAPEQKEVGGLSGAPLKAVTTEMIRDMYARTRGELVIIGVGGIENGEDAYAKIKAVSRAHARTTARDGRLSIGSRVDSSRMVR
jgi:dihydroorotate dehydrogenase